MNQFTTNPVLNQQGVQFPNQRPFAPGNSFNNIVWVQGIEGAKAFQLPPNSRAHLMDSENEGIFYIKTSDDIGMCNLRIFGYTERASAPTNVEMDLSQYVRKDELQDLLKNVLGGNHEQSISTAKSKSGKTTISE